VLHALPISSSLTNWMLIRSGFIPDIATLRSLHGTPQSLHSRDFERVTQVSLQSAITIHPSFEIRVTYIFDFINYITSLRRLIITYWRVDIWDWQGM
jgi:hypothetical protein